MADDRVYEKQCPLCDTINTTTEIQDEGKAWASIKFQCSDCGEKYTHYYYGSTKDNQGIWETILRKPFDVICIGEASGVTIGQKYSAFWSAKKGYFTIQKNDNSRKKDYKADLFISNKKK